MPEVRRGSSVQLSRDRLPTSQSSGLPLTPPTLTQPLSTQLSNKSTSEQVSQEGKVAAQGLPLQNRAQSFDLHSRPNLQDHPSGSSLPSAYKSHRRRTEADIPDDGRRSLSYAQRGVAPAYYDSRAGTHREWRRRGKTLQEYYDNNPQLLPQLPFTWHHGWKRWKLFFLVFLGFVDASAVPIGLYYGMTYAGNVQGWIVFAIVTSIWGGPAYFEVAIRSLRLIKKEKFFRPLGADNRWSFDILTWILVLTIGVVTTLFIVGSAPHIVWLRVLCMPGPAILYCLGGSVLLITLYYLMGWKAPFRISSTTKGEKVLPGVYYVMEDIVAVNAGAGRPYREALAARYQASPRFQRMLYIQSLFWSIPSLVLAVALTVVAVIPPVPAPIAYGVCWAVPFIWAFVWAFISIRWCKRDLVRERLEWERDETVVSKLGLPTSETADTAA